MLKTEMTQEIFINVEIKQYKNCTLNFFKPANNYVEQYQICKYETGIF